MTPVSPVTKTARQAQIAGILARTAVRSQEPCSASQVGRAAAPASSLQIAFEVLKAMTLMVPGLMPARLRGDAHRAYAAY